MIKHGTSVVNVLCLYVCSYSTVLQYYEVKMPDVVL
jgi:hypothetical protein